MTWVLLYFWLLHSVTHREDRRVISCIVYVIKCEWQLKKMYQLVMACTRQATATLSTLAGCGGFDRIFWIL